ncbi:MAG: hypothetical protein WCA04_09315 [Geobacteraceae bacterium]
MSKNARLILLFGVIGLLVGASVGYLYRPPAFLTGQLPFHVVITRGGSLKGLDQIYLEVARTSFNYLLAGGIIGAALGIIGGVFLSKGRK